MVCCNYNSIVLGFFILAINSIFIGFIIHESIQYHEFNSYKEHQCNITRITRPTQPYSSNYSHGYGGCRCFSFVGGRLTIFRGVYGCLNFYPSFNEEKKIIPYKNVPRFKNNYCAKATSCTCRYYDRIFRESNNIYNQYINKNAKCYYKNKNEEIYLNIGAGPGLVLIFMFPIILVIIGIFTICMCRDINRRTDIDDILDRIQHEFNDATALEQQQRALEDGIEHDEIPPEYDGHSILTLPSYKSQTSITSSLPEYDDEYTRSQPIYTCEPSIRPPEYGNELELTHETNRMEICRDDHIRETAV